MKKNMPQRFTINLVLFFNGFRWVKREKLTYFILLLQNSLKWTRSFESCACAQVRYEITKMQILGFQACKRVLAAVVCEKNIIFRRNI